MTLADRYTLPTVQLSPNVWLPSDQETRIDVPVTVPWALVPPLAQTTLGSSTISYRARGSANVSATRALAIDFDDFTVDEDGVISRDALINAAARSIFGNQVQPYDYNRPQQQGYPNGAMPNGQFQPQQPSQGQPYVPPSYGYPPYR